MWGIGLSLALTGSGVAFIVLGLQVQNAAEEAQAATLFKWVPGSTNGVATESFINSSNFNFAIDAPEYTNFYLWNLTNAEALLAGGSAVQPELQQVGPYTYEKRSRKLNVQFYPIKGDAYDPSSYGAVSYQVTSTYHFSSERSNGSETDHVVTLNSSYVRRLTKMHAQAGKSERFLVAEFAHAHIRDYTRHLQTEFLASTKLRALRALLPEMVSAVRREGMAAVIDRQQRRVADASLPAKLVRMDAIARTEQIPVMLREVYRDQADIAIPGLLTAQYALARRQAVPRVLSNLYNRLQVESAPALLGRQVKAQQVDFVPRTLNSLNLKMQRIAFPYVLQEVFDRACLEVVPFLLRAIKTKLVAQDIANNQATADDAQLAVVQLWRLKGSSPTDLDAWIDDSPTGQPRSGFELPPASSELQLSLEVATLLLGSRPSNLRFSLVDYDAAQTAADGLKIPIVTAVGFAIWKQVVALNEDAITYLLDGVNNDVAATSDFLTRAQLMAVRDYIIGWAQSSITLRDRQRFWRKAFTKRTVDNDVNDPDVDLDLERVGVQSGFSLLPSSASSAQVSVGVAQQVWNASIGFSFVNPAGFSKWMSVVDGVATASTPGLLAGITGITASEVTIISTWITAMLADGFVRRRALLHWTAGTCLSVLQVPRTNGCLRYDLEPNIDGQQLGFEMNPTAVTNIGTGISTASREALWDATLNAVSFLVPEHPSNTANGYGQWLFAIRTGNFGRLLAGSPDLTTLAVTEVSAQAIGAWLNNWADNGLNKLAVYYWWLRSTCWPREVLSKVTSSTTPIQGLADCTAASSEQELTSSSTTADASPFSTFVKTYQVTEDECSTAGAPYTRTRNIYTLTARVYSCDVVSTGLADDLDDATTGFELMPLAQTSGDRIGLATAIVLWDSASALSFCSTQGYQRWVKLAASISSSAATAAADTQVVVTELNVAITLVCITPTAGGGASSGIFNVSFVGTGCTQVTAAHVTQIASWVSKQSGSDWVLNALQDQWRRGVAGALDIEPYRDGAQSGLELSTGCETTLFSLTLAQCQAITTESGTKYEVPRDALKLWKLTHGASFLTVAGYTLWDALASAVESNSATSVAASQKALAKLCGSAGAASTWDVWMERVFQWISKWKSNEYLQRDVLGHWLYASCPTTPTIKTVLSEPTPVSTTVSSCTASYTTIPSTSVADLQQLASRPVTFFDADVVQKAALVQPRKTVVVNEAWVRCARLTSSSFTKTVGSRQSQTEYQACNLLSVLATPAVSASDVTPMDAMFELNRSTSADISLDAAKVMWDPLSVFSLLNSTSFFKKWYPAIDRSTALQQLQNDLNTFVSSSSTLNLAALQSYLKKWESSDAASSSVASSWISINPASVDVDIREDGDQRGFELSKNDNYLGTAIYLAVPTLVQAKALWKTDSVYSLVRSDNTIDSAGLPTGFRAWAEMYEGTDWESGSLFDQYPLTNQVNRSTTMTYILNAQQRTQLLAAITAVTSLTEAQVRGIARWLLNWATDDSLQDFVQAQWATGETFRGDSKLNLDLASHLQRLYSFSVTSDMSRDVFTTASAALANASRASLRKLWNVSTPGSLVDPGTRVVWCMLSATNSNGATKAPCADLLDGYGELESTAFDEFVAVVQPTIPDSPIIKATADLYALARDFLVKALGLTSVQLTAIAKWYRNIADASLFSQVYQLDKWSTANNKPSQDPLQLGFELAFVLPWNASVPRNVSVKDLVPNVAIVAGSTDKKTLSNCDRSLSLFYTLWDDSNPISFLHPTGVSKWLSYVRGGVDEVELFGGASANNPTAKVISAEKLSDTTVSCLFQLVGNWLKSWSNHPSARMFVENFWIAPITQSSTATKALLPAASDIASAFPINKSDSASISPADPALFSASDWWAAAARIVLNVDESLAFANPDEGFALWRALLITCFSSDRATGKCQQPEDRSLYESSYARAQGLLSLSLCNRIQAVSTAFLGIGDAALMNYTSSMIQWHIVPWLTNLLDHAVLKKYVLERVRNANGDSVANGPASFVDLAAVQFVNGSVTGADYIVNDSSTGVMLLEDPGVWSERFPREGFAFDSVSGAIVRQNSSFLPGYGELQTFCSESGQDRRFTYDAETSCSFGTKYSFSISEASSLWMAFGFNDTTLWTWPPPSIAASAYESGVPFPSSLRNTTRIALLLDVFLAQPFETVAACKTSLVRVIEAYDSDWSANEKQQLCVDRKGEAGAGTETVYLRLPILQDFYDKPVEFVPDMQAYLRYAATKFGYEPSILRLSPSPPGQRSALTSSMGYPVGGYFASLPVSEVLFASLPSEASESPEETPLWPNATNTERGASTFNLVVPLNEESALYDKSKNVIGQLLAVDNKTLMNAWGEDVKLSSVRVTDGSQFTTAVRIGLGENTVTPVEFPPQKLYFYWAYARRVAQIGFIGNTTRFGVSMMRYRANWTFPSRLPTGIVSGSTVPTGSLNMSFLNDDLPLVLQRSSSPGSPESVLDIEPRTGSVLHRRLVWQLTARVGDNDNRQLLNVWHKDLALGWVPVVWIQEEVEMSVTASTQMTSLGPLTTKTLSMLGIAVGSCVIVAGCALAYMSVRRARLMRLQRFTSIVPEGSSATVTNGHANIFKSSGAIGTEETGNVEDVGTPSGSTEAVQNILDQTEGIDTGDAGEADEIRKEATTRAWLHRTSA